MHATDCQAYFKSEEYSKCDAKCQHNNQEYHMCCEVWDYCAFYRTEWFLWVSIVFVFFMVMASCFGSLYSCLQLARNRGRGDRKGEDSQTSEDSTTTI
ncbi:unnamed protein product [Caenorhabditis brenneri]